MRKSILVVNSHQLAKEIYLLTLTFPQKHQFSIGEQLRRAVLSIPLNITEGNARIYDKEKRQFLSIAFSSLKEVKYLLYFCNEINLIDKKKYEDLILKLDTLAKLLFGLLKKLKEK